MAGMAQPSTSTTQEKVIDLTGLPEKDMETVRTLVELMRQRALAQPPVSPDEWGSRFEAYLQEVTARADRYPSGFVVDDSRESIYEGCCE